VKNQICRNKKKCPKDGYNIREKNRFYNEMPQYPECTNLSKHSGQKEMIA